MIEITLKFKGYNPVDGAYIPNESGIYCIYKGISFEHENFVNELLYIGESGDVQERFEDHEHYIDWFLKLELENDEQLFYSFAIVNDKKIRKRAEAALVYEHKAIYPDLINTQSTQSFNWPATRIKTYGKNELLVEEFELNGYESRNYFR